LGGFGVPGLLGLLFHASTGCGLGGSAFGCAAGFFPPAGLPGFGGIGMMLGGLGGVLPFVGSPVGGLIGMVLGGVGGRVLLPVDAGFLTLLAMSVS
jgi:hypothetical protein